MRASRLLAVLALVPAGGPGSIGPRIQEDGAQEPATACGLSEVQTRALVARYRRSEHWALRGIVLLALGERWHPVATEAVIDALGGDRRLRAYAIEALLATSPEGLRVVATTDLVDELALRQLDVTNRHYQQRVAALLARLLPEVGEPSPERLRSEWRRVRGTWAPGEWIAPPRITDGRTSAVRLVERAFDLSDAGLEVVVCIDTTGSMQPAIDAVRDAIEDLVALLRGVAPRFRLGLVEYRDYEDLEHGARRLVRLTRDTARVRRKLGQTRAEGGGDPPERVESGLAIALGEDMGWERGTNKVVVVIGDAPPHDQDLHHALQLVRDARERPFGAAPSTPRALAPGRSAPPVVRPFVTATIAVARGEVDRATEHAFLRIAQAGGGAYASLDPGGEGDPGGAIVRRILALSFGSQWSDQVEGFVELYLTYHREGFFR